MMTKSFRNIHKSLLHKLNVSCGRPLVGLFFAGLIFSCASSTDDGINPMETYYIESQGLVNTTLDSTENFAYKYNKYVFNTKGAQDDKFYKPTMKNLCTALDSFGSELLGWGLNVVITIDYKWEGDTTIYF